ncbi:Retrovirus-related Pol polyprotein from type-2 retrotransposable element R2DM; Endonuclease [Eumeta japonica]|uniref:Retrovirus-related Pol polyprotein from type-2 retrotransposable element R2DM Endonuclease n=1 Tax=Eumeta variegata TaxID=151549 RepID=A0A4C1YYR5_EUMVA|nr:Retrovirus-related Pol polyprotein from type-2 retrotransposable element R2DM; Endonuclease [Eumeta japonica]
MSPMLDEQQPVEQAGFRRSFSTIDHIHTVKQILEKYNEYNKKVYIAFIDYAKAFDSLNHSYIWNTLEHQEIPASYINIIEKIYVHSQASIQLETLGKDFPIKRGVRQGDSLSPKLFSAVLENIFRNLNWEGFGLNINGSRLNHLRFADDLVLFEEKPEILEQMIKSLSKESETTGLKMNLTKTKIMTNSIKVDITVNGATLQFVNEYTYLGQLISPKDLITKEVNTRIANAKVEMDRIYDAGQTRKMVLGSFRMVPKRWEEKLWKTVHKMGGWLKVETGNSGQTTVEIIGRGLCQEAH